MRPSILLALALLAAVAVSPANAHGMHLRSSCSVSSDYDLDVRPDHLAFSRDDGTPHAVVMQDGRLRVDGRPVAVSAADATRLRQYESQVRVLLPEVLGIARDGVGIGFNALSTVAATFADSPDERAKMLQQLSTQRQRVQAEIDHGMASGSWRQDGLDHIMDHDMGEAVATLASTVAARAVKAALSGDQHQIDALEARADSLEQSIHLAVEAPAERLGQRAEALCPQLTALQQLQRQFSFRLADGSPLTLMTVEKKEHVELADVPSR